MRVVVTGAAGFVGRALVRRLRADGHDVVATDRGGEGVLAGDLRDAALRDRLFAPAAEMVVHLATVPGGATEVDPDAGWDVNVAATRALVDAAVVCGARLVYASSIAVLGDQLPPVVDDATPSAPTMFYGVHKLMMEEWIAGRSRRGDIDALSVRLPGLVARPRAPSGMTSAFMSDLFHAFRAGEAIDLPVGPDATMWLLSREAAVSALVHALRLPSTAETRVTLPALVVSMRDLVQAVASATGRDPALARYVPVAGIERTFGRQPRLSTPRADALGFRHDGTIVALVAGVLSDLDRGDDQ